MIYEMYFFLILQMMKLIRKGKNTLSHHEWKAKLGLNLKPSSAPYFLGYSYNRESNQFA